ncbi:MAG: hypothetical protein EA409_05160 [Saprospirales bacterium]|nr:MAG: hypothetical protein EA409_05160 [Saprospirales bacterium]
MCLTATSCIKMIAIGHSFKYFVSGIACEYAGPDTIYVDSSCTAILFWDDANNPSCESTNPGGVIIRRELQSISGGYEIGDLVAAGTDVVVTYRVSDNMGNVEFFSFSIHFTDTIPPVFDPGSLPADTTIINPHDYPPAEVLAWDNCDTTGQNVEISVFDSPYPNVCVGGEWTRTYIATDHFGNQSIYVQTITQLPDTTAPVFIVTPIAGTSSCDELPESFNSWLQTQYDSIVVENPSGGYIDLSDNAPSGQELIGFCGILEIEFIAMDSCGNQTVIVSTFEVFDTIAPIITKEPENLFLDCTGSGAMVDLLNWLENFGFAEAEDNCGNISWEFETYPGQEGFICNDTSEVFLLAFDACGNATQTSALVLIQDTTGPVFLSPPSDTIIDCNVSGFEEAFFQWINIAGGAILIDDCSDEGDIAITLKMNGLQQEPEALWSEIQGALQSGCMDSVLVNGKWIHSVLVLMEIEFVAKDFCGNESSAVGRFVVTDTLAPLITVLPSDMVIDCSAEEFVQNSLVDWLSSGGGIMGEDGCSEWTVGFSSDFDGVWSEFIISSDTLCGNNGRVGVQFYIVDACGNKTFAPSMTNFETIDILPPVVIIEAVDTTFQCRQDINLEIQNWISQSAGAVFLDSCSDSFTVDFEWESSDGQIGSGILPQGPFPTAQSVVCNHNISIVFTVTDECGNSLQFSSIIEIIDTLAPSFDGTADTVFYNCNDDVSNLLVSINDPCSDFIVFFEDSLLSDQWMGCAPFEQVILRTISAEDICGNTSTFSQIIIISDFLGPTFDLPPSLSISCELFQSLDLTGEPTNLADNCFIADDLVVSYLDFYDDSICEPIVHRIWSVEDGCGNMTSDTQFIHLIDTLEPVVLMAPSDLILQCNHPSNDSIFESWLVNMGGGLIAENCGPVLFFYANSGSYDINDPSTFPGTSPVLPDSVTCYQGAGHILDSISVDFVFYDLCFNVSVHPVMVRIVDNDPPVFAHCPEFVIISADTSCIGRLFLPEFSAYDLCGLSQHSLTLTDSSEVASELPGSSSVVVFPVELSFEGVFDPLQPILSMVLDVELIGIDGEQPTEYFELFDESGNYVGRTNSTDQQCGYSLTSFDFTNIQQINSWAIEDEIRFTLVPYTNDSLPLSFFINDICQPGLVVGNLQIERAGPSELDAHIHIGYELFFSIEDFPEEGVELNAGIYPGLITATDCSGNKAECRFEVHVRSDQSPEIVCPESATLFLSDTSCYISYQLPGFTYQSTCEDFGVSSYSHAIDSFEYLRFFLHPDLGDYHPHPVTLSFDSLEIAQDHPILLNVQFKADIDSQFAFFEVFSGNGIFLGEIKSGGTNTIYDGGCSEAGMAVIEIPNHVFNDELQNGYFEIVLSPFQDIPIPPGGPGSGINPCNDSVIADGQIDGLSFVRAFITYHPVKVSVEISGPDKDDIYEFYHGESPPESYFRDGNFSVNYIATDPWGNSDTCSFEIEVIDSIPPVALCKNARIEVLPSVLDTFILDPEMVNGGSFDNCGIDSLTVFPSRFTCDYVGKDTIVTLNVFDAAGNSSSCTAFLRIDAESPMPSFVLDLCQPDTLFLFSNAPGDPTLYSYTWEGPLGFTSSSPNPVISGIGQSNSGIYSLMITGFGGCTASASVNVSISTIATPQLQVESTVVCSGDQIRLSASLYTGNITYKWYSGTPPSGVLLGETSEPNFSITHPEGNHRFYVIVENPDCASNPSNVVNIEVVEEPNAIIDPSFIRVCSGNPLTLNSPLGPAFEYSWSGPAGFVSDMQSPLVAQAAGQANAGIYNLVVTLGTCTSQAATAEVMVDDSPPRPIIQGKRVLCAGDSLQLRVSNIPIATRYTWMLPDGSEIFTSNAQLILTNANQELSGEWKVFASFGQCDSPLSEPFIVTIEEVPVISITNNSPVCEGDTVILAADVIPGSNYQWIGPGGFSAEGDTVREVLPTGIYSLRVETEGGCVSFAETSISVKVRPRIDDIAKLGDFCIDGETDFCLQSFVSPPDNGNYIYNWIGPQGFNSNQANPCISNANEINSGLYFLQVALDGCFSDLDSTRVELINVGDNPGINTDEIVYCEGDTIVITADYKSEHSIVFNWVSPAGVIITADSFLILNDVTSLDQGTYSVFVVVEQCTTNLSEEIEIVVNPVPQRPFLSGGGTFCERDSIVLITDGIPGITYMWLGPHTLDQGVAEQTLWPASPSMSGVYRVEALLNGCLSAPSLPQNVLVNPLPPKPIIQVNTSRLCIDDLSSVIEVCLETDSLIGGSTFHYFLNNELEIPAITSNSVCLELTGSNISKAGFNTLQVRSISAGCLSDFSMPVNLRADTIPSETAFAGEDLRVCEMDSIGLMADFPQYSNGIWSSISSGVTFDEPVHPVSNVSGLRPGLNPLVWSLSSGSCINFSRDTVLIDYLVTPLAFDDSVSIVQGESVLVDILDNDIFPAAVNVTITEVAGRASVEVMPEGNLFVRTDERWPGTIRIDYMICLKSCPEKCSEASLYIFSGDIADCEIPNIFTPDGDGINDAFIISCLASGEYPNNKLRIYDQWGSELFRASPYRNDWEGTHNGRPLPNGNYFYVMDFGDGRSPVSGFVVIKR